MSLTLKPAGFLKVSKVFLSVHNKIFKYFIINNTFSLIKYLIVFVHEESLDVLDVLFFNRFPRPNKMNSLWYIV